MSPVLLFDYGGTLDADGITWLERFHALYLKQGLGLNKDEFSRAFYKADDELPQRHALKGLDLAATVRLQAEDVLRTLAPKRLSLAAEIASEFTQQSRARFKALHPFLDDLRQRFKLGVVSNFYGNLESVLAGDGLDRYFSAVADSAVIGVLKPDPAIFQNALGRLEAAPGQAWMIGDSKLRDMAGAEALGMDHVWLNPVGGAACCASGSLIRSLFDLDIVLSAHAP